MPENKLLQVAELDGIGPVVFTRNYRSRNLKITLKPGSGIQVTVPVYLSIESARKFVMEKRGWIIKQQAKLEHFRKENTLFDEDTDFATREHKLVILKQDKAFIKIEISGKLIAVYYPAFASVKDLKIQQAIRRAIVEAWRIESSKVLPGLVKQLAFIHGFTYNRLTFRNNKTRWGSCSRDNNISLNIQLMRLPDHLCEYIILHELAHTIEKNHQAGFWALLDRVTKGNARKLDKEINRYNLSIW